MAHVSSYTTLAAWPLAICQALEARKFQVAPILKDVSLCREQLRVDPDGRIDIQTMTKLWDCVLRTTKDECFGLRVAEYVQPTHFRALGMLLISAENMEQAFLKLGEYAALISNSAQIDITLTPDRLGFFIQPISGVTISSLAIDSFMATFYQFAIRLGAQRPCIASLDLMKPLPNKPSAWEAYFQAPVSFGQQTNCLWVKRSALKSESYLGNQVIASFHESLVKDYLASLQNNSFSSQVKHYVLSQLEKNEPRIEQVAEYFQLSPRSLRRRLQLEGTHYRQQLQLARMELAQHYLRHTSLSITDIALRAGFSDSSAFSKAFFRHMHLSPSVYRASSI